MGLTSLALGQVRIVPEQSDGPSLLTKQVASPAQVASPVNALSPDALTMRQARQFIAANQPAKAKALLDDWIETNELLGHPALPEALYLRGNAKLAMNDEYDALYDYEEVVRNYPGSEFFASSLEREFDVAKLYLNGRGRPGWLGLRIDSGVPTAEEIIIRIGERMPGSTLAERAILELADYYARTRDLRMAVEAYDVFVRLFPRSALRAKAMQRRIYASVGQFKGPQYDVRVLKDAQVQIEDFASEFPGEAQKSGLNDGLIARLDESAAAGMLSQARWYIDRDDPVSARLTLVRLVKRHPRTAAAHDALALIDAIDAKEPGLKKFAQPSNQIPPAALPVPAPTLPLMTPPPASEGAP